MGRLFWLLPFLLFISNSFAADYYWGREAIQYPSAVAACPQSGLYDVGEPYTFSSVRFNDAGDLAECFAKVSSSGMTFRVSTVRRYGDSCPSGTIYNKETGSCDIPPKDCSSSVGTTIAALSQMIQLEGGVKPNNNAICDNGCKAQYSGGNTVGCGTLKSDPTGPKYCIFTFTGTGNVCEGNETPSNLGAPYSPEPPKDPNDPTDPANNCKAVGYVWSGTSCVKYWEEDKKDPTQPGGNGDTGSGGSGGGGGGGTGSGGTGSGTPKPGSDTDEKGNAGGGAGGVKEEGTDNEAGYSDVCDKPPVCEGDVFSCAILNQNHHDACQLVALPTAKEAKGRDEVIQKEVSKAEDAQKELDNSVTSLLGGFKSAASGNGSGGKCLPDKTFSVRGNMMTMEFSKACDSLSMLKYAVLAMAYLAAARIVSREI